MKSYLIFILIGLFSSTQFVFSAQEVDANVASELRRLPWLESNSIGGEVVFKDLSESSSSEALTNDRFDIPRRVKKQTTQQAAPTNRNPADLSWLQTTIWIVLTLVVLAIVAAFIWIFLKMENARSDLRPQTLAEEDLGERVKQLPFQLEGELAGDFKSQAEAAAQRGDFGRATMLLFSHVLISLDQRRLIRLKKGKTNRQYLLELAEHRSLKSYFEDVMIPFEDHFFGSHNIDEQRFQCYWSKLDRFLIDIDNASGAVAL